MNQRDQYEKPRLAKLDNIKRITAECANWQCSATVPPPKKI